MKRAHTFGFELKPLTEADTTYLRNKYIGADAKKQEKLWDKFKDIQKLCRNTWGPIYSRERAKYVSGDYDYEELVLSIKKVSVESHVERSLCRKKW